MKTKRFCWILLLNLLVLTAGAEPYDTVVLKNGSVLEGYISVQHPGKDIIFFAEKATVYIPVKQVKSVLEYDIEIETLSDPWKAWVGDNPLLVKTVRGSKFLQMTDIILAETAENDTVVRPGNEYPALFKLERCSPQSAYTGKRRSHQIS